MSTEPAAAHEDQGHRKAAYPPRLPCFNGLAKAVSGARKKGDLVAVEGRLHYTKWQDRDGNDRYGCEIIADRVEFY